MEDYIYILFGAAILLIFYFSVCYIYYRQLFYKFRHQKIQLVDPEDAFYVDAYQWYDDIPKEAVHIKSYDGLTLQGIFIPSHNKNSKKLAIVIHGYQSKAHDMAIIGKMYSDLGFKVLMLDQRGHGNSEGKFTSVGYYESLDLKRWLHFATRSYGANIEMLIHGVSMGASTAILATRFSEIKNVKMMVLDSVFTNFRASLYMQVKKTYQKLFIPGVSLLSYLFLKFFISQINPLKYIKRTSIPSLFIYSTDDGAVSKEMVEKLHKHLKTDQKRILTIENSRHAKGFEVDKAAYIDAVIDMTSQIFKIKKSDIKYIK